MKLPASREWSEEEEGKNRKSINQVRRERKKGGWTKEGNGSGSVGTVRVLKGFSLGGCLLAAIAVVSGCWLSFFLLSEKREKLYVCIHSKGKKHSLKAFFSSPVRPCLLSTFLSASTAQYRQSKWRAVEADPEVIKEVINYGSRFLLWKQIAMFAMLSFHFTFLLSLLFSVFLWSEERRKFSIRKKEKGSIDHFVIGQQQQRNGSSLIFTLGDLLLGTLIVSSASVSSCFFGAIKIVREVSTPFTRSLLWGFRAKSAELSSALEYPH